MNIKNLLMVFSFACLTAQATQHYDSVMVKNINVVKPSYYRIVDPGSPITSKHGKVGRLTKGNNPVNLDLREIQGRYQTLFIEDSPTATTSNIAFTPAGGHEAVDLTIDAQGNIKKTVPKEYQKKK